MLKCVDSDKHNNKTSMVKSDSVLREMCSVQYVVHLICCWQRRWWYSSLSFWETTCGLHLSRFFSGARLLVLSMALGDWFDQYWILLYQGRVQEDDFEQRKKLVCLLYELGFFFGLAKANTFLYYCSYRDSGLKTSVWPHSYELYLKGNVSLSEQIWRNLALHHLLTNGSSAGNGCRQSESSNSW